MQFLDTGIIGSLSTILLVVDWIIRIVALFVVPRNRKPTAGTAWLLFIFFAPVIGMLVFIILGSPKLPKSRRDAQKTIDKTLRSTLKRFQQRTASNHLLDAKVPEKYYPLAKLCESLGGLPVFDGNSIDILPDYDDALMKLVSDIDEAEDFVHIEYFIIAYDDTTLPIFDALARAVQRGVVVRVLYDSLSIIRYPKHRQVAKRLKADGVFVQPMLPLRFPGRGYVRPDLRNHRKLVVIDNKIGYTGSQNLIKRNYHRKDDIYYDEMVVRVRGPIVLQIGAVFASDWFSETGKLLQYKNASLTPTDIEVSGSTKAQVLPSGPGYDDENNLKLFTSLIHLAQKRIVIVNPYFVPDDALMTAITSATKRGVTVEMINSEVMDQWMVGHAQRSFYELLMKAGVTIHLYKAPVLLHSKFMVVDDEIVTVGSSNLDIRSFQLDLEITLVTYDPAVAKRFNRIVNQYLARTNEVKMSDWQKRSRFQNLLDNIARLTSALQ